MFRLTHRPLSAAVVCCYGLNNSFVSNDARNTKVDYSKKHMFQERKEFPVKTGISDFRSDTFTKPSSSMRQVMAAAEVGDDVFGEDPTVKKLEKSIARMFEKEAALFCPTGTMANLLAVMCWCDGRGSEMILGDNSHIYIYEQGGAAFIAGVASRVLPTQPNGVLKIEDILKSVRVDDIHFPVTRLVCLENTHNMNGGRVLPDGYVAAVKDALDANPLGRDVRLHVDGARIWNASAATGLSVAELTRGADSVSACMSKGLGAPAGSMLVGPADFIAKARRLRKALGGGMRQTGILAAACLDGLEDFKDGMMLTDHQRAKRLAREVSKLAAFHVDVNTVDTNIVIVHLNSEVMPSSMTAKDISEKLKARGVLCYNISPTALRLVMHRDLSEDDIDCAIRAFAEIHFSFAKRTSTRYRSR